MCYVSRIDEAVAAALLKMQIAFDDLNNDREHHFALENVLTVWKKAADEHLQSVSNYFLAESSVVFM